MGEPEECGFHLVLLFPGRDPLQEKREQKERELAEADRERRRLAEKEATGLSDGSDEGSGDDVEARQSEADRQRTDVAGDEDDEEDDESSEYEEDEEGDWVDIDDEEEEEDDEAVEAEESTQSDA